MSTRTIARNSVWLTLDHLSGILIAFVCSILVARALGPAKLGYYQYVLWIASVTRLFAELGVPPAARKFAAEYMGKQDLVSVAAILRTTLRFQLYTVAVVMAGGAIVVATSVAPEHRLFAALAVASLAPSLIIGIPSAALVATENLAMNTISSVVSNAVNVTGVLATLFFGWELPGLAGSLLASRSVDLAIRYGLFRRAYRGLLPTDSRSVKLAPELRARIVRFCWQQTVLLVLQTIVWDRSEMLFLRVYADTSQISFYSQPFNMVQMVLFLPTVLAWSAGTTLMVEQGRNPQNVARIAGATLWMTCLIALPATFGLAAIADPFIRVFLGPEFLPAIEVLQLLGLFGVFAALLDPTEQIIVATENQGFFVRWNIAMIVVFLAGSFLFVPRAGAVGAALSKSVTMVVGTVGLIVFARRRLGVHLPMARVARVALVSFIMFAVVRTVGRALPPAAGLPVGILLGVVIVVVLLRVFRCLDQTDRGRFFEVGRLIPSRFRGGYESVVRFVIPEVADGPDGDSASGAGKMPAA